MAFYPHRGPLRESAITSNGGSANTWRPLQQLVTKDKAPALGSNRGPPLWVHFLEEDTPAIESCRWCNTNAQPKAPVPAIYNFFVISSGSLAAIRRT